MRLIALAPLAALVTGCAVVSPQAWTYDAAHPPKAQVPMEERVALDTRAAELQTRRNDIRGRIAAEPDVGKRLALYSELHAVGSELSPLERRLSRIASAR